MRRRALLPAIDVDKDTKKAIANILYTLGTSGMSDDETDSEPGVIPKVVRRRKLNWLSEDVSAIMHALESYRPCVRESPLYDDRGNKPLKRRYVQSCIRTSRPVTGLPLNWYDEEFIRSLSRFELQRLEIAPKERLPFLVRLSPYS